MFWIILAVGGFLMGSGSYAMNQAQMYPPFAAGLARKAYKEHPDLIPQVAELIAQRFKGIIPVDEYYQIMKEAGYNEEIAENLFQGAQQFLSGYDYVNIWRRGEISDEVLDTRLSQIGYNHESQEELKKATLYYPNPNDLVRMAVREVFTPEVAERYGQFEDLPDEFLNASDKAGLSRDFARNYWAAHWELPSAFQGFEMFQRDIINKDDLLLLLKNLDYMPYWRDKMVDLQYNVITRVDVRRLYKTGVYNETQVFDAYRHMGYSPKDAKDLTDFTIEAYPQVDEEKQSVSGLVRSVTGDLVPSRAMVMDAYKKGIYDYTSTVAALEALGYPNNAAVLLINLVDEDLKQDIIDIKADAITDRFRLGSIDEGEYRAELTALGVTSRYIELVIAREMAQAKRRSKSPTKSDLEAWVTKGLISDLEYLRRMESLGYTEDDSQMYLDEILYDIRNKGR